MCKINTQFNSYRRQCPIGSIEQGIRRNIVCRTEPFPFKYSPERLGDVQMWAVMWQEEKIQPSLLPYWPEFFNHLVAVNFGIIKHDKGVLANPKNETVKEVCDFFRHYAFCCAKPVIEVITVNHSKDIPACVFRRRYENILPTELPAVRHIPLRATVAFVCEIKVDESLFFLSFKFFQLLALIRIELQRGFPLGTFSYTSISCGKADKKTSEGALARFLARSLAFFTLSLSFSIAARTASSSEQSMIGLRPRSEWVSRPWTPFSWNLFSQEFTEMCVISVCKPTSLEVRPYDFKSMAQHRIRNAWLLPLRKLDSNSRRCASVRWIILIFAITMCIYEFMQRYTKFLI